MRILVLLGLLGGIARADVARYALVVGNDAGAADEPRLRFAETDAERFAGVLRALGDFPAGNVILLKGARAEEVRDTLIGLNERIRLAGGDSVLVVFYSGHADAEALHLGGSALPLPQLEQLVRGSAATFRLLIADACRSGVLTRVKGGSDAPPFPIQLEQRLPADGVVFWSSSAASEDAQESDELGGSFFTHYLVSGLRGPADVDGDGHVTADEAYAHAHDHTLRASSRTLAGVQHPTFRVEVGGRGDVVLTSPGRPGAPWSALEVPAGRSYLVLAGDRDGAVVGEVGAADRRRWLALPAGRYYVRARAERYLLEGTVVVAPGQARRVVDAELERFEYARLVRKGGGGSQRGIEIGYAVRSPLLDGARACQGIDAAYTVALSWITLAPRIGLCHEPFANDFMGGATSELRGELAVRHAWDLRRVTLHLEAGLGGAILRQAFDEAPSRWVSALTFGGGAGITIPVERGWHLGLGLEAATYVARRDTPGPIVALRGRFLVGRNF